MESKPIKPGVVYIAERKKLYYFQQNNIVVMSAWPDVRAWVFDRDSSKWLGTRPKIRIPKGDLDKKINTLSNKLDVVDLIPGVLFTPEKETARIKKQIEVYKWASHIPAEIRGAVSDYSNRHWHLLSMVARCNDSALQLMLSNPALAYMLASNWVFHKPAVRWSMRSIRALLNKKQKDILPWLGFQSSDRICNILKKIEAKSISISVLLKLRSSLQVMDPKLLRVLAHLPRINAGVLYAITDPYISSILTPNFYLELSQKNSEDTKSGLAFELYKAKRILQFCYPEGGKSLKLHSIDSVISLPKRLKRKMIELGIKHTILFSPPPFKGTDVAQPIQNSVELIAESKQMRNCVSNFMSQIMLNNSMYLYRVLEPERATIVLSNSNGVWKFDEIKGVNNVEVKSTTLVAIKDWVIENGLMGDDEFDEMTLIQEIVEIE